jgi:sporulation protein YlmC with PRC-barrel domain
MVRQLLSSRRGDPTSDPSPIGYFVMEMAMLNTKMTAKLTCGLAIVLGSVAAAAQEQRTPAAGERGDLDEIRKVSTLIGTHVMNRANTKIAEIRDLAFSPDGAVEYAVLGHGGVGGVGETYTAAPFGALEVRHADGKWTASLDKTADDLKKAPAIQSDNDRELTDQQWIDRAHQFFCPPSAPKDRPVEWVLLASKVRSAKLKNAQNEELGKVEDVLLDRNHRAVFVVAGRGGVLGVGEHFIPVPWSKLGLSTNPESTAVTVSISATKAQLDKAPLIKGDYATLLAHGFADEVRRYFGAIGATTGAERR